MSALIDVGKLLLCSVAMATVTVALHLWAPQFYYLIEISLGISLSIAMAAIIFAIVHIIRSTIIKKDPDND